MSYLFLRNKTWHVYYYDSLTQKAKSFSTRQKDKTAANKILKNFQAKKQLGLLSDGFVKKESLIKFSDALNLFLSTKNNNKTKYAYQLAADHFAKTCGNKILSQYNNFDYYKLADHLNALNLSQNSKATYTRHLYSLFNWFVKNNFANKNIIVKISSVIKEVEPISFDHVKMILENLASRGLMKQYHLIKLLYLTAFRIGEMLNSCGEDFNIKDKIIFVRNSKGKRIDKIPMLEEIELHLLEFPLKPGKIFDYKSIHSVKTFWKTVNRQLGFNYKIHQLRKSRGTELANLGINPYFLQKFMRHNDLKTTMTFYVKIDLTKMKKEIDEKICNRFAIDFRQG